MGGFAWEAQQSFWRPPDECHELVRLSHVGTWWRATCSCGHQTPPANMRALAVGSHRSHRDWLRAESADRTPRS